MKQYFNKKPNIAPNAFIHPSAVIIGDVTIGADSSIWPHCTIRGDINRITIGERSNIQDGTIIHVTCDSQFYPGGACTTIGNDVTVGHRVLLHACTVQDFCLIGMGSIILDKAILEPELILGAGSLVPMNKVLTSGYLWMGNPVKQIRPLKDSEREYLRFSSHHYVEIKNMYS